MWWLYQVGLGLAALAGLPVFAGKLVTTPKYRAGLAQRLGFLPASELKGLVGREPYWIHAVSVGEVLAAVPLARAIKEREPDRPLLVTTVTATGQRTAREHLGGTADAVCYFPLDLPWVVRRVAGRIRPRLFVIMETEIWPNWIRHLHGRGTAVALVNGRISDRSYRGYRRIRFFLRRVLPMVDLFAMQGEEDARRVIALGAPPGRVHVTGSIKFDRDPRPMAEGERRGLRRSLGLPEQGPLLVAGSTHAGEEEAVLRAYVRLRARFPDLAMVVAPRHPERGGEVAALLQGAGVAWHRRTRPQGRRPVLLLDTVGELSGVYAAADVAFVGGSLVPAGGHNILEPAAHGVPVLFGPHMENFAEIRRVVLERGGGAQVRDREDLARRLEGLLDRPDRRRAMGEAGMALIRENRGALRRTVELLEALLAP